MMHFGANLKQVFATKDRRPEAFRNEQSKSSETATFDWIDRPREPFRELQGCLIGEPVPA